MTQDGDIARMILGSGRSGTTWIADALAEANGMGVVFEPLHPVVGSTAAAWANRYVDAARDEPALRALFAEAIRGELMPDWTRYRALPARLQLRPSMLFRPRQLKAWWRRNRRMRENRRRFGAAAARPGILKLIRANLMHDWLLREAANRLLCVVRHPGAVVESRMRLDAQAVRAGLADGTDDWKPGPLLAMWLEDEALMRRLFGRRPVPDLLAGGEASRHAAVWCVENALFLEPVQHAAGAGRSYTVYYEDLTAPVAGAWDSAAAFLGLAAPTVQTRARPSQQASEDFAAGAPHARWVSRLDDGQKAEIDAMLDVFGIDLYRCDDPAPRRGRAAGAGAGGGTGARV